MKFELCMHDRGSNLECRNGTMLMDVVIISWEGHQILICNGHVSNQEIGMSTKSLSPTTTHKEEEEEEEAQKCYFETLLKMAQRGNYHIRAYFSFIQHKNL